MSIRKIDDDIRNRYPYPLAATFQRAYYDTRDIALIHDYLFDLFEVTLKYLASCMLAQYIHDGAPDAAINQGLLNLQRPSLGHWQGWLRDTIKLYQRQKRQLLIPEIAEVYEQKSAGDMYAAFNKLRAMMAEQMGSRGDGKNYSQVAVHQFFDLLGQYRNRVAHGAKLNVYDRKQVVEWLLPAMRELFVALEFTTRYRLVFVNEVKLAGTRREMSYEHFYADLMGYRPSVVAEPAVLRAPAGRPGELYLCAKDDDFAPALSLHPFLIFRFCRECSTDQAFVLNQSREDNLSYLSYQCSHQFSLTEYLDDIRSMLTGFSTPPGIAEPGIPAPVLPPEVSTSPVAAPGPAQNGLDPLLAQQQVLAEERRRLEEERQRIAAERERLRREQEEQERLRRDQAQRAQADETRPLPAAEAPRMIGCRNCGHQNKPGRKFCSNCGSPLALATPPAPQPGTAVPQPRPVQPAGPAGPYPPQPPTYVPPVRPAPTGGQGFPQSGPAQRARVCPRCAHRNLPERRFCTNCGLSLAAVPVS